jgi:hypothetical protein
LRCEGMTAPMVIKGAMNGEAFVAYVEQCLVPTLLNAVSKRESNSTFPDAGLTAMLGSMIEMDGWGDGRGVVRGS